MRPQDREVLLRIGDEWTDLGPPNSSYAARPKAARPPSKTILKRLLDSGYVNVRTVTVRTWGGAKQMEEWLAVRGVKYAHHLSPEQQAEYADRFHDKVTVEARLTDQGRDVKAAIS